MRLVVPIIMLITVLAGCSKLQPGSRNQPGGKAAQPPQTVAAAGEPAVPAAPREYAPGVALASGAPPMARPELRKVVSLPAGVPLYRGPGDWYGRYTEPMPSTLPYGVLWNGWLGLRLERGLAWMATDGRWNMADQDGDGATYTVQPPEQWLMAGAGPLKADVRRPRRGVFTVEVTGAPEAVRLTAYPDAHALYAEFPTFRAPRARIDIGEEGFGVLSAAGRGLLLEFASLPSVTVLTNKPGLLRLEFRPVLEQISVRSQGPDQVVAVAARGHLPSSVRRSDGALLWTLHGAVPGPGVSAGALNISTTEDGVTVRLEGGRPHRVRPAAGGMELVLQSPGLAGKRIVIDPGHGGTDTGTATPWGAPEKELNLAVATLLAARLERAGARVLLLRTGDTAAVVPEAMKQSFPAGIPQRELTVRSTIANWWDADMLVSVHHNGGPNPAASGTEVYWHPANLNGDRSEELARLIQNALVTELGTVDRGTIRRPFTMVRMPYAPAALIEIGFLTNAAEARRMTDPAVQERSAAALMRALEEFFRGR